MASTPQDRVKVRADAVKAAHAVGTLVYGNQWGYMQQAKLLQTEARRKAAGSAVTITRRDINVVKRAEPLKVLVKVETPKKLGPQIPTAELVPQPGVQLKDQLNQILSRSSGKEQRVVAGVDRLVDYIKTLELPANGRIINPQYQFTPDNKLRLSAGVHAEKKVLWSTQTVDTDFWALLANAPQGVLVEKYHVGPLGIAELFRGKIEQNVADLSKKIREKVAENAPGWEVASFHLTPDRKLAFDFRKISG